MRWYITLEQRSNDFFIHFFESNEVVGFFRYVAGGGEMKSSNPTFVNSINQSDSFSAMWTNSYAIWNIFYEILALLLQ